MNHRVKIKKFNRDHASRKALMLSLSRNFFISEKIETTLVKAKALRSEVEKIITTARDSSLASRRKLLQKLQDKELVEKLLSDIGPRFKDFTQGGYTRIRRTTIRKGDGTQLAQISLIEKSKPVVTPDKSEKSEKKVIEKAEDTKKKTSSKTKKEVEKK